LNVLYETVTIECGGDEYVWDGAAPRHTAAFYLLPQRGVSPARANCFPARCTRAVSILAFLKTRRGFVLLGRAMPLTDVQIRTHMQLEMRGHRLAHGLTAPHS
jgi:hypothetical protein